MATVYRCDRDGQIGEESGFLTDVVMPASPARFGDAKDPVSEFEKAEQATIQLCPSCMKDLRTFIAKK